jgi:hypothetical protein
MQILSKLPPSRKPLLEERFRAALTCMNGLQPHGSFLAGKMFWFRICLFRSNDGLSWPQPPKRPRRQQRINKPIDHFLDCCRPRLSLPDTIAQVP